MPYILLTTARPEALRAFSEALAAAPEVRLERVASGAEALRAVQTRAPDLAIIDGELPDFAPLELVRELLRANAMVNTAVLSPLPEPQFHDAAEGLGVLAQLPTYPGTLEAKTLLDKFKRLLAGGG